jgi:hypothetical protein
MLGGGDRSQHRQMTVATISHKREMHRRSAHRVVSFSCARNGPRTISGSRVAGLITGRRE